MSSMLNDVTQQQYQQYSMMMNNTNTSSVSTPVNNNNQNMSQNWYFNENMFGDLNTSMPITPLGNVVDLGASPSRGGGGLNNNCCIDQEDVCQLGSSGCFDDSEALTNTNTQNQQQGKSNKGEKKKQKIACVYCNKLHSK